MYQRVNAKEKNRNSKLKKVNIKQIYSLSINQTPWNPNNIKGYMPIIYTYNWYSGKDNV